MFQGKLAVVLIRGCPDHLVDVILLVFHHTAEVLVGEIRRQQYVLQDGIKLVNKVSRYLESEGRNLLVDGGAIARCPGVQNVLDIGITDTAGATLRHQGGGCVCQALLAGRVGYRTIGEAHLEDHLVGIGLFEFDHFHGLCLHAQNEKCEADNPADQVFHFSAPCSSSDMVAMVRCSGTKYLLAIFIRSSTVIVS